MTTTGATGPCTKPSFVSSDAEGTWQPANGSWFVNNNAWSGSAGPQTIDTCAYNNWYVVSNQTNQQGAIETYPDTEYNFVPAPYSCGTTTNCGPAISSFSSITSSFSETVPTGNQEDYDFGYDTWVGGLNNNACTEVMIWNQFGGQPNPGSGAPVNIGGQQFYVDHNSLPSSGNCGFDIFVMATQVQSGSVNILPIYQYMVAQGWLTSSESVSAIEYGVEIAGTNGPQTYAVNNFSLTVNGSSISD